MQGYNKNENFGHYDMSNIEQVIEILKSLDQSAKGKKSLRSIYTSGSYDTDVYQYLKKTSLDEQGYTISELSTYLTDLLENLPNYSNPGTMINVIGPVNLFSAAAAGYFMLTSANLAQDTYAGNIYLSEFEVIKYMSELAGWNWSTSSGLFTFGGKGTNLYATKIALMNADPGSYREGLTKGQCFIITSSNGHPCHAQVCDWLGLGKDACIEIECNRHGVIDLDAAERVIRKNIESGRLFLGMNLNGGSTNELAIDPIYSSRKLIDRIYHEYQLSYKPFIHVDSVLGWVYLMFDSYDFDTNPLDISNHILNKIRKTYEAIAEIQYADSMGIDFHKTGFCPYISSLFMVKDHEMLTSLNPEAASVDLIDMKYGDYNPYQYSLECSRSAIGPIAALTVLKSMGRDGFRKEVANLVEMVYNFRQLLKQDPRICLIDKENNSFATMFIICPEGYTLAPDDLYILPKEQIDFIREYNVNFGKYLLRKALKQDISFVFTSSRSYLLPGSNIKVGALKAWMISVFQNQDSIHRCVKELASCIDEYYNVAEHSTIIGEDIRYFSDPSTDESYGVNHE